MDSIIIGNVRRWMPYVVYVRGFSYFSGWNGAYFKKEENGKIYYELMHQKTFFNLIHAELTIIERVDDRWILRRKDNPEILARQYIAGNKREIEYAKRFKNDGSTPLGAWEHDIDIDYEFMPGHVYAHHCLIWFLVALVCCAISFGLGIFYSWVKYC